MKEKPEPERRRPCILIADHFCNPVIESRYIIWFPAGYEVAIGNHFLIFPIGTRVAQVFANRREGGHVPTLYEIAFDKQLRTMANGCNDFIIIKKLSGEFNGGFISSEFVGVYHTTRQYQ